MLRNDKTPAATGVCQATENLLHNEKSTTIKGVFLRPRMGRLLTELLVDHVATLRAFNVNFDDRITQNLIDCYENGLIENGWREGGGHES
jgi:hypothetical protein